MKNGSCTLWFLAVVLLATLLKGASQTEARAASASQDNLISNGSFENLIESFPQSWKEDPKGGWGVGAAGSFRGNSSLKATTSESSLSQEIAAKPETEYVLRAYVRSDISIPDKEEHYNTFLTLECLNWRKKVIKRDWGIVNATSSWELKENLIFTPAGTRKIRIKLAKRQGEGSVWFDEVRLVKIASGLVTNSGFEMLDNQEPRFWNEDENGGWSVERDHPWEGEKSMRASVASSWLSQEVPVKPGTTYLLEAHLRSDITSSRNTALTLECLDENNGVLKREWGVATAISSWQVENNLIFTPPDTRRIRIRLTKREGEGSVWFDEVKLIETPMRSIPNSSFEILNGEGRPSPWLVDNRGGWSLSDEQPYEGKRCMRADQNWSWLSQEVPVKSKRWYVLEVQVKSDTMLTGKVDGKENTFLTLECLDGKGQTIARKWGIVTAFPLWHRIENRIYAPENTERVRIKLAKRRGQGSVWFDDVRLVERLFLTESFPRRLTPLFNILMYFLLVLSFLTVIIKTRSKTGS